MLQLKMLTTHVDIADKSRSVRRFLMVSGALKFFMPLTVPAGMPLLALLAFAFMALPVFLPA
ncbi:hypothetical protein D3C76_1769820 [compost metagenome]